MRSQEKAQESDTDLALPSNVVPFPRACRAIPAVIREPRQTRRLAAVAAAELNARLLILLGICTTSASSALLAVHLLHG